MFEVEQLMLLSKQLVGALGNETSSQAGEVLLIALFVSGTIGSRGAGVRGTSVFGGDVVISGSLHGGQGAGGTLPLDIGSDGLIVSGTAREATTTINGTHVSSSLNISGS